MAFKSDRRAIIFGAEDCQILTCLGLSIMLGEFVFAFKICRNIGHQIGNELIKMVATKKGAPFRRNEAPHSRRFTQARIQGNLIFCTSDAFPLSVK